MATGLPAVLALVIPISTAWLINSRIAAAAAKEPLRYRALMPITILEKFVYTVPVVLLYLDGRVQATSCCRHWSIPFSACFSSLPYVRTVPEQQSTANAG